MWCLVSSTENKGVTNGNSFLALCFICDLLLHALCFVSDGEGDAITIVTPASSQGRRRESPLKVHFSLPGLKVVDRH